jgi:hypothetical protein
MSDTPIPGFIEPGSVPRARPFQGLKICSLPESRIILKIFHICKSQISSFQIKMEHQNIVEPQFNANIPPPSVPQQHVEQQSPPAPHYSPPAVHYDSSVPPPPPPHREHQNQSRDVYGIQYRDAATNNGQQQNNGRSNEYFDPSDQSQFKVE